MEIFLLVINLVLFVGIGLGVVALLFGKLEDGTDFRAGGAVLAVLSTVLLAATLSVVVIPAGTVGVVTAAGAVQSDTLQPGVGFRFPPFYNTIHTITTRVQPHAFKEIDAASSEYQSVKLTGVMNYHIDGRYASDLYQRVGDEFAEKILDPAFNDFIKSVVPEYSITEILAKRDEIRSRAKSDLQASLAQYHIVIDDIFIANIGFSKEYEAAIEAKQVAAQQVDTEKQITQQRIQQAEQAKQQAIGAANALRETAKGQADANDLITKSLSPELIQYTLIQKLAPTIQTLILPAGQNFILDPKALAPKQP